MQPNKPPHDFNGTNDSAVNNIDHNQTETQKNIIEKMTPHSIKRTIQRIAFTDKLTISDWSAIFRSRLERPDLQIYGLNLNK